MHKRSLRTSVGKGETKMYMKREYTGQNVYDALQEGLKFIFVEFDNIFVSFSGGKDSGLLLNCNSTENSIGLGM